MHFGTIRICFSLEMAQHAEIRRFIKDWEDIPALCARSFIDCFWDEEKGYLADCLTDGIADWSVRPNQIFAVSLEHSPLSSVMQRAVMDKVAGELLTPKRVEDFVRRRYQVQGQVRELRRNVIKHIIRVLSGPGCWAISQMHA